jgi:hypothetical protein
MHATESSESFSASLGRLATVELREVGVQGFRCFGNERVVFRLGDMPGLVAVSGRNEADSKDEAGACTTLMSSTPWCHRLLLLLYLLFNRSQRASCAGVALEVHGPKF